MCSWCDVLGGMSRNVNRSDNAVMESSFQTLKVELVRDHVFATMRASQAAVLKYLEIFWNRQSISLSGRRILTRRERDAKAKRPSGFEASRVSDDGGTPTAIASPTPTETWATRSTDRAGLRHARRLHAGGAGAAATDG
jgi:Integrase core domain